MHHISRTSRSFILLVLVVLATIYTALVLLKIQRTTTPANNEVAAPRVEKLESSSDTSQWKRYEDNVFPIAFMVPIDWRVTHFVNDDGTHDFAISPKGTLPPITIMPSTTGFIGTDGLTTTAFMTKNNHKGIMISDSVYGIKHEENYYTFDGTLTPAYLAELKEVINSIELK